jgi:uncharacterized membrane protein HdeD (DUF308 family)
MSEHDLRRRLNPTVVKGAVYSAAGLSVLVAPEVAMPVLRFLLAGTMLAVAVSNLWGHSRVQDSAHGRARGLLALATAVGILAAPRETQRTFELMWGTRENADRSDGSATRIQTMVRYGFGGGR